MDITQIILKLIRATTKTTGFMFCCALVCVHSSFVIILMGKRVLAYLLCLSIWCLVIVVWLFLKMPRVCLQFVIMAFPDHTQYFRIAYQLYLYTLCTIFFAYDYTSLLCTICTCVTDCTAEFV